jgi:alcohol dehydrogenase
VRAVLLERYGPPEVLRTAEVPDPVPGPGDALIEVRAAGVNPIDTKIRRGSQRLFVRYKLPWVLGLDVAGVVRAVGPGVEGFAPGDAVCASLDHKRWGSYAELVCSRADLLATKPEALSFEEAAALPLAGLTAWQCLERTARLTAGQSVLVQAGAGGVGHLAIQLAVERGARVATTCSARNLDWMRALGAERAIDYTRERYDEVLTGQDVVLDALGGEHRARALRVLRRGGYHVSITSDIPALAKRWGPTLGALLAIARIGWFRLRARLGRGVRSRLVVQRPSGEQLRELCRLAEAGGLKPRVDTVYPLERAAEAHRHSEGGHARGKIILTPIAGAGA